MKATRRRHIEQGRTTHALIFAPLGLCVSIRLSQRPRGAKEDRLLTLSAASFLLACFAVLLIAAVGSRAQQPGGVTVQQGTVGPQGVYAIRNARIVTVSGPEIESGTIVIRNGKIEAVGANAAVPNGAQEIDARGLTVYPGMIDAGTSLGLVEIPSGAPGTVDLAEVGDINPNARAIVAVNPHSAHIAVTRVGGVTSAVTLPLGGLISGQAALINLSGTTPREMAFVPDAALVINFPRVSIPGGEFFSEQQQGSNLTEALATVTRQVEQMRKLLRDAEAYGRAQDAYASDARLPRPDQNVVLASLVPYVRGTRPVILRADRETEIRAAVLFAEEMHLRPIILGGNDASKTASFLKEHNVPVILTGLYNLPTLEDDFYDTLYENAAKLQQAGVRFCISTGNSGANARDLPYEAGLASAFGLPRDEALKAVTLYPAQIMNVADRMGSIEPGKLANLVITDGDLLEPRTHVRYLFINGRQLPLTSRHTELYEQFKDRK
ncbi:MAG TPA: amidohydrolase family protein [Pyrinomonadaceae bacterium]|jgi:imidazolonepropionase-like amidohydrolase|nr:amidohydrolase family protein [Pyrinomonadaceae bacterium]